ncbi:hypothetical protein AAFF_G00116090 [Aldrovandia affinis]|uniref:Uncharacterized protein n=1 Tax=Aldrovandia affinis TaxID=143900 RepID=A0AAD7T1H7_9TELE|nr:hypothetical protein AAFF_G00116090 [Aldrovandia affinis]
MRQHGLHCTSDKLACYTKERHKSYSAAYPCREGDSELQEQTRSRTARPRADSSVVPDWLRGTAGCWVPF